MKRWLVITLMVFSASLSRESQASACQGKFANPITDICWSCLFPLTLGGTQAVSLEQEDTANPSGFLCTYPPRIGIKTGEPARRADVTRTPYCLVSLGGIKLDPGIRAPEGEVRLQQDNTKQSSYQVHWYADPVLYWLLDNPCLETGDFDVAYLTEVDPTWNDDELTLPRKPSETPSHKQPVRVIACCRSNALFWCAGCQGTLYPLNGHVQAATRARMFRRALCWCNA